MNDVCCEYQIKGVIRESLRYWVFLQIERFEVDERELR